VKGERVMASVRILHSGNLVRNVCAGDRKLFMEKYYDPEKYMELGTCFVREDGRVFVLLRDGVRKIDGGWEEEK
jgi:hypothetical protein